MENTHLDPARGSPHHPTPGPTPRPPAGTPTRTPAADSAVHELRSLGDFRILQRLGEGGMGIVYRAYDGRHERYVALKVVNDSVASSQAYIDRFYREVRSGTALNHPNIVRTYTAGQDGATRKYYLVLEYVDGQSAQALLERHGKLAVGDAVHVALDVARALEHAHSRNIIHRDIKPDNILITRSGVAKLGDLGLAKRLDEASHLTSAKQGFGTTAYMPYEQAISAKHADGRSDIYALGATLYHLLTGQVPFPGDNHLEVVEKKNVGHFVPAGKLNAEVPLALDLILGRMLARQPRDRYQTASELIIDLERSRLAVPVPSFADPELAKNDPWMQATATRGEPTRLDPERAASDEEEWEVHYHRLRPARPLTTRLTAEEIVERLQEGTLPADAEARRPGEEKWRPLAQIAPFRDHLPKPEEKPKAEPARPGAGAGAVVAVVASGVVVLGGVVGLLLWLVRGG